MDATQFEAVTCDGEVYCTECLPTGIAPDGADVHPIFANQAWDHYPVCSECGEKHEYVTLTDVGDRNHATDLAESLLRQCAFADLDVLGILCAARQRLGLEGWAPC